MSTETGSTETAVAEEIRIAKLEALSDLQQCVDLQVAVWGYADGDVIPRRMFLIAQRIGGQVMGAFAGERMVGFAMGLPGFREGSAYLHSHMLAVLPEYRNAGLGRRLKLAQREDAVERGFALMEWTFDPLEIKNAYLNLHRLGAVARRYQPDFYGPSSSPLQGGLPTDRLYAEWWLQSERVVRALRDELPEAKGVVERVEVPAEIYAWKREPEARERAAAVQRRVREGLQGAFGRGLGVVDFVRGEAGDGTYLLGSMEGVEAGAAARVLQGS